MPNLESIKQIQAEQTHLIKEYAEKHMPQGAWSTERGEPTFFYFHQDVRCAKLAEDNKVTFKRANSFTLYDFDDTTYSLCFKCSRTLRESYYRVESARGYLESLKHVLTTLEENGKLGLERDLDTLNHVHYLATTGYFDWLYFAKGDPELTGRWVAEITLYSLHVWRELFAEELLKSLRPSAESAFYVYIPDQLLPPTLWDVSKKDLQQVRTVAVRNAYAMYYVPDYILAKVKLNLTDYIPAFYFQDQTRIEETMFTLLQDGMSKIDAVSTAVALEK